MNRRDVVKSAAAVAVIAAVPPIAVAETWQVYRMNDCDWFMARSLDEAVAEYRKWCGYAIDDRYGDVCEDPHEETRIDDLHFVDELESGEADMDSRRTFREELAQRVAFGAEPELFASTEY